MNQTAPMLHRPSKVNDFSDGGSASESLNNVLVLLDETRTHQLVQHVIPIVTYNETFKLIGKRDGVDPPTELCSPCRELMRHPPTIYSTSSLDPTPEKFWVPYHDTLFQLIDCCFSRFGSCRLCQLLWHGIQHEILYYRSNKKEVKTQECLGGGLKLALRHRGDFTVSLELNIFPELTDHNPRHFRVKMLRSKRCSYTMLTPPPGVILSNKSKRAAAIH